MEDLLGLAGFAVVAAATALMAIWNRCIAFPLAAGFTARVAVAMIHSYVTPLPGGLADAVRFEEVAWEWAEQGLWGALGEFTGPSSYFYSVTLAALYAVTSRSAVMAQALSVLAAMGVVVYTYRLSRALWSEQAAVKAAWVAALFPLLVFYSVFTLRESFVSLAIVAGAHYSARWGLSGRAVYLLPALAAFLVGVFYHAAVALAIVGLILAVLHRYGGRAPSQLRRGQLGVGLLLVALPLGAAGIGFAASGVRLPKIGSVETLMNFEGLVEYVGARARDGAAYPDWILPDTPADMVWNVPARLVYFFLAPFPWDVRRLTHLQGLFDGMLYTGIFVLIWRNRHAIRSNPGARTVLWVMVPLALVFAVGTSNFGNGIRHRSKLVSVLVVLSAPCIPRLVWTRSIVGERLQTRTSTDFTIRPAGHLTDEVLR